MSTQPEENIITEVITMNVDKTIEQDGPSTQPDEEDPVVQEPEDAEADEPALEVIFQLTRDPR